MKHILRFVLVFLLCLSLGMPATWAATTGEKLEVTLKIGSNTMQVNGKSQTIEKPYIKNNTTMVPLSVITRAFGAKVSWDSNTKTVTLQYGDKTIQLKVGSKQATTNGKSSTLAVAPEIKNGLTMVPLRFVSEALGAEVKYDAKTKTITITGTVLATNDSGLDTSKGKTKMGDSYYGWTMKYPTGLSKKESTFNNDALLFTDVNEEYSLAIFIYQVETVNMTYEKLLESMTANTYGTIFAKSVVNENGKTYARLVLSNSNDSILEMRGYIGKGYLYYLYFNTDEKNYDNAQKYKGYKDFLDSFTLSFDKTDKSILDFSTVKDGYRTYTDKNFGLSFNIPADWYKNNIENDYLLFENSKGTESLYIDISSLDAGDSLDYWFTRFREQLLEEINPSYTKMKEPMKTTVSGTEAREWEVGFTTNNKHWAYTHEVFLVKGNYKFNFKIFVKEKDIFNLSDLVKNIVPSITIDTAQIKPSIGYIQDTSIYDKSKTDTYKSTEFNYSLDVPSYWEGMNNNPEDELYFEFWGGYFGLNVADETLEEAVKRIDEENAEYAKRRKVFEIEKSNVVIAEVEAVKYQYSITDTDDTKYQVVEYLIHKDGKTYQMSYALLDANRTEKNLEILQKTIESFTFLK